VWPIGRHDRSRNFAIAQAQQNIRLPPFRPYALRATTHREDEEFRIH
jgi:hypothetical protein